MVLPQRLLRRGSSGRLLWRRLVLWRRVEGVGRPHVKGAGNAVVAAAGVQGLGLALQQHLLLLLVLLGHAAKAASMGQALGMVREVGVKTHGGALVALGLHIKVGLADVLSTAAAAKVEGIAVHAVAIGCS